MNQIRNHEHPQTNAARRQAVPMRFTSSSGMGLVQVIVAAGLIGIILSSVARMMSDVNKSARSVSTITSRKMLEDVIRHNLADYEAARMTVKANPNFMQVLTSACPGGPRNGELSVRTRSDAALVPSKYTAAFAPCTSSSCDFVFSASWGCQNDTYWVDVQTKYAPNLGLPGYVPAGGTLSTRMPIPGSFWKNAAQTITWGSLCSPDTEIMRGINPDGTPNCERRVKAPVSNRGSASGQYCNPGQVMVGISNDGRPVCEDSVAQLGIKMCVQISDRGCRRQVGKEECTPCLNELKPGEAIKTAWASDTNKYDPDCTRLIVRRCNTTAENADSDPETAAQEAASSVSWPTGRYCIIQAQFSSCPAGFTAWNPAAGATSGACMGDEANGIRGHSSSIRSQINVAWGQANISRCETQRWSWCCR